MAHNVVAQMVTPRRILLDDFDIDLEVCWYVHSNTMSQNNQCDASCTLAKTLAFSLLLHSGGGTGLDP